MRTRESSAVLGCPRTSSVTVLLLSASVMFPVEASPSVPLREQLFSGCSLKICRTTQTVQVIAQIFHITNKCSHVQQLHNHWSLIGKHTFLENEITSEAKRLSSLCHKTLENSKHSKSVSLDNSSTFNPFNFSRPIKLQNFSFRPRDLNIVQRSVRWV